MAIDYNRLNWQVAIVFSFCLQTKLSNDKLIELGSLQMSQTIYPAIIEHYNTKCLIFNWL